MHGEKCVVEWNSYGCIMGCGTFPQYIFRIYILHSETHRRLII